MADDRRNGTIHRNSFVFNANSTCPIADGEMGFWRDDTGAILRRAADGSDAVVVASGAGSAPFFACLTKTAAPLAGSPVYDNGTDGAGATLIRGTAGAIGTVGGVALTSAEVGKLILVDQQATAAQNGVYVLTSAGSGSVKYKLTRVAGMDSVIVDGAQVAVQQGTYADQIYEQYETVATVGADDVNFQLAATAVTFTAVNTALAGADASVSVNSQKITNLGAPAAATDAAKLATVNAVTSLRAGYVAYSAPLAAQATAGACTIVADVAISAVALTLAAQPDVPRKLVIIKTDADSSYAATLTIVGVGPGGNAATETVSLLSTDGTHTYTTTKAYATITSATVSALSGNTGVDKIAIGLATALGLPVPSTGTNLVVYKEAAGATIASTPVNETVGTTDTTARTVIPTTAADGTKALHFWFAWTQPVVQQ